MIEEIVKSFIILFVILDPVGLVPVFISFTKGFKHKEIAKNASRATVVAATILMLFLFFGVKVFEFFRITTESFLIAGGIVLFIFSVIYILGMPVPGIHKGAEDIASVPFGVPLISGPGTITMTIILVAENGILITFIAAVFALLCTWLILRYSGYVYKTIGRRGTNIVSRIMGLILAAIAVQFIINGVQRLMG